MCRHTVTVWHPLGQAEVTFFTAPYLERGKGRGYNTAQPNSQKPRKKATVSADAYSGVADFTLLVLFTLGRFGRAFELATYQFVAVQLVFVTGCKLAIGQQWQRIAKVVV